MKNKKFLILLCIPLIIAVMVLPLCSFVTTPNPDDVDYYSFSPLVRTDIGYTYHRTTSGGTEYYYTGYIPNFTQVISRSQTDLAISNIAFYACDYYVNSDTRFSLKTFNQGSTLNNNTVGLTCVGEDNIAYFNGHIKLTGVINADTLVDKRFVYNTSSNLMEFSYITNYFYGYYDDNEVFTITSKQIIDDSLNLPNSYGLFYAIDIYNIISDSIDRELSTMGANDDRTYYYLYASSIELSVREFNETSDAYFKLNSSDITVYDTLYSQEIADAINFGIYNSSIAPFIYDNGYNRGLQDGLNGGAFRDFGEFLKTTVSAFLDMHITPNITISGILSVIISIGLVVLFLRLFAGG